MDNTTSIINETIQNNISNINNSIKDNSSIIVEKIPEIKQTIISNVTNLDITSIIKPELISTIDPNWFFSAMAQSSAAIVGIMGAFLTSKIIAQKQQINSIGTEIKDNKDKIKFLKKRIKTKVEWVEQIDEEEDLKDIKKFLNKIQSDLDIENPPSIDELIEIGNSSEDEDFHNLNKELLESSYNEEYFDEIRAKRAKQKMRRFGTFDLGSTMNFNTSLLISPEITGKKWDRYRRYNDEIYATNTEIEYLENLIKVKEDELLTYENANHVKLTLYYLGVFSIIGVFGPLGMMTLDSSIMYKWIYWVYGSVTISWFLLLGYFLKEIFQLNSKHKNK